MPVKRIWLEKDWPKEVPKKIEIPDIRIDEFVLKGLAEDPNMHAMWFLDGYYSYKELNDYIDSFASSLKELGAEMDDVLAIILPNCPQFVITYMACQRIGVTVTTINPLYSEAEMRHTLKGSGAKYAVVLDAVYEKALKSGELLNETSIKNPDNVITTNLLDLAKMSSIKKSLAKMLKIAPKGKTGDTRKFLDMLKTKSKVTPAEYDPKTHVASLLWTGGTTGMPKAAMLSTRNIVANCLQSAAWFFSAGKGDAIIGVLPCFHSFGQTAVMNVSLAIKGFGVYFPKPPETIDLLKELSKVKKQNPNSKFFYPGAEILFKRIADLPQEEIDKFDLAGVFELCISGAGPLHRNVQEAFEKKTGAKLVEGYGLTETTPVVSAGIFFGNRKIGTIGLPLPNTDWKIVDRETGEDLKGYGTDVIGEIAVAGPQVMLGYLPGSSEDAEEQTKKTLIKDKEGVTWLLTGDIGYMDETGRITIMDRKKELIKYHGYSVFPKEVESYMYQHEAVLEVAVAGIPDEKAGELVKAWVVLKPEYKGKVTEEDLIKWAKEKMAKIKAPRLISFVDELPKTMVGKVLRRVLKEQDLAKMKAGEEIKQAKAEEEEEEEKSEEK
ncbi:MAG: AMP-binding protein [Promethearchaeota archaeon]